MPPSDRVGLHYLKTAETGVRPGRRITGVGGRNVVTERSR
jgi:hypothetical protein